jgi:cytoskeletal protein RodZ
MSLKMLRILTLISSEIFQNLTPIESEAKDLKEKKRKEKKGKERKRKKKKRRKEKKNFKSTWIVMSYMIPNIPRLHLAALMTSG